MKSKYFVLACILLLFASCGKGPEHYYFGDYSEAERLYNREDYKKAIVKYQAYLDDNPEGNLAVISQYYIGRSYAALGRPDEAVKAFDKVVKDHPKTVWANFAEQQMKEIESRAPKTA